MVFPWFFKAAAWTLYRFCAALLRLATSGRGDSAAAKSLAQLLDVAAWGGGKLGRLVKFIVYNHRSICIYIYISIITYNHNVQS